MSDLLWLIRKTLTNTFRSKKSWFIYIGLPIVGVLVSMLLYSNENSGTLHIGIVNRDGDQTITQNAIRFLESMNQVKVTSVADEPTLNGQIAAGQLDSGILFGAGFASSVRKGEPEQLTLVSVKGAQVTAYVKSMLHGYIGNVAAIGRNAPDDARFAMLYDAYDRQSFKLTAETVQDTSNTKIMTYQSIGFLITFMMFSAVNMSEIILKDKENRTFLRLLSSPVSAKKYVLSNVVANAVVLLLQIVVTLFIIKNVFHTDSGIPYRYLVPALFLFGLTAIGLSLLIVAFSKNSVSAGALQNLIITPTCLLAGCFFPMDIMPDTVRNISKFMPQHWLLDMINKLQQGQSFGSLSLNMAILIAFAAAFALIATFRFGRNNDIRQFV
ncbi:ABC transporter permease [Paenibacillus hodogayensis]|uniref:Transport permease protein n=1 Tax=Paenibacillus hodogayensis TaxID=279208 RepID=A0ABV5VZS1_9BACL